MGGRPREEEQLTSRKELITDCSLLCELKLFCDGVCDRPVMGFLAEFQALGGGTRGCLCGVSATLISVSPSAALGGDGDALRAHDDVGADAA